MVMKFNESQTELQVDDYSVTSVRLDLVAFETTVTASLFALSTLTFVPICHR